MKKRKIVKISKYRRKHYLPVILVILAVLAAAGGIVGYHLYDEYHTYKSSEVREFKTGSVEQDGFVLVTEKKEILGRMYVGFVILDASDHTELYRCPTQYPVGELSSIAWEEGTDSVVVVEKDDSSTVYVREGKQWKASDSPAVTPSP